MDDPWGLDGKVAIVTGASSGLGHRFAELLASVGAEVVASARRVERLAELAGSSPRITAVAGDVADPADRARLVDAAVEMYRRVDVLVNNAGIGDVGPAEVESQNEFARVLAVNLEAPFALSQLVVSPMVAAGGGSIVNIGSIFGLVSSAPIPQAGYVASKAGLHGLTRELAVQWAAQGIRVNAVAPGWFRSEMTGDSLEDARSVAHLARNCPMARVGEPEELDGALLFLAGRGSSYCTGQVIVVDGGWTAR